MRCLAGSRSSILGSNRRFAAAKISLAFRGSTDPVVLFFRFLDERMNVSQTRRSRHLYAFALLLCGQCRHCYHRPADCLSRVTQHPACQKILSLWFTECLLSGFVRVQLFCARGLTACCTKTRKYFTFLASVKFVICTEC